MKKMKFETKIVWSLVFAIILMCVSVGCTDAQHSPSSFPSSTNGPVVQQPSTTTRPTTQLPQPTTQPTAPTQQPTQPDPTLPIEPHNPVPEHLRNNYYLGSKGQGDCEEMLGDVNVLVIFVSDTLSKWDAESIEAAKRTFADHETNMEAAAKRYGAEMEMTMTFLEATIAIPFVFEAGKPITPAYSALKKLGMGDAFYDQEILEKQYEADSVPVLFVLNRQGRAFALAMDAQTDLLECAVIYGDDLSSVRHELYHIFGAQDFYFPDETIAAQEKYLPNSIMNNHYHDVDDLTAFLIGWLDELSQNALNFLEDTNHLTKEEIEHAKEQN